MVQKQKNNKKITIFTVACLVIILIGIITFLNSGNIDKIQINIEQNNFQAMEQEAIEEVGQNGMISEAIIIGRQTGIGPFDNNDEPGNDSSEYNNIVRSFDQVTWTIENTMKLKNPELGVSYKGGVLEVKAELPENVLNVEGSPKVVEWDFDSMTWAEDVVVSDDGRIFTAKYTLPDTEVTVPGKQTIIMVLKVLGVPNGLEIKPTFTMNLAGNTENEKKEIKVNEQDANKLDSVVKVSAVPRLNVLIKRNPYLDYKSYFDETTGNDSDEKTETTTYGRMQGYGIALQLYNSNADNKLKGIELPKGDITFDLTFNELIDTTDVTDEDGYTPKMWEYKESTLTYSLGKNGKNMMWQNNNNGNCAVNLPLNQGSGKYRCYSGGNWNITQDESNPYIYHVTVNGYQFDNNYDFPTNDIGDNSNTPIRYGEEKGIGCFSTGYVETIMQIPENVQNLQSINMKATVSNINAKSITEQLINKDENQTDNTVNSKIQISPIGGFSKLIWIGNSNSTSYSNGDSNAPIGYDKGYLWNIITANLTNDKEDWIYGIDYLVKFDGEAMEPILYDDEAEYNKTVISGENTMTFNVLYAGKRDKSNWNSDEEMVDTTMDNLIYFDTLEELKQNGYICVGAMVESLDGYGCGIVYIKIPYKVKDTAQIGNVYQAVNDLRIYNKGNVPDRTTQTHLLTTNKEDYPEIRYSIENKKYIKTAYDEYGQVMAGTHYVAGSYGDSLLVLGANQTVKTKSVDSLDQEKNNYNLSKNENVATFKIEPSLSTENIVEIDNVTLKIVTTLPKGLRYKSSLLDSGEPEIIENEEETQTLIWHKYGCKVNEQIEPIMFNSEINQDLPNGTQLEVKSVIMEELAEGEHSKIGNTVEKYRTSTTGINIINLSAYSLYKTTNTPRIEKNGEAEFTTTAINKTEEDVDTFQLLDILPYNGDARGSNFSGTYEVEKITLKQIDLVTGEEIINNNLKLYTTSSEGVRTGVTVKDNDLGTSDIWSEETSGNNINQELIGYAVIGKLTAKTKLEIEMLIKTNGNKPKDIYQNLATAQTNVKTEEIVSPIVSVQVIKRTLEGKIWFDSNKDGVISSGEEYLSGIKVKLLNEDGTKAKDIDGNEIDEIITASDGTYKFEDMTRGKYKVEIEYDTEDGIKEITKKNVGSNIEINSKFNSNGSTNIITELDSIASQNIKVEYQNAGITYKDTKVTVHHYIEETTTNVPLKTGGTAEDEIIEGKVKDTYTSNSVEVPEYYELVAIPENSNGTMTKDEIVVTYYYRLKQYPYTVKYIDKDTNEEIKTQKSGESKDYGTEITVASEKIEIERYTYDSSDVAGDTSKTKLTIGKEIDNNVINLYYTKKMGNVIVKYIDKTTGKGITVNGQSLKEEKTDQIYENYTTTKKEIQGYTYVEDTGNIEGIYTLASSTTPIEVIYYYRKNTKVITKYVDKATGEEIPNGNGESSRDVKEGLEGDIYTTTSKNFDRYVLVTDELPTNSHGIMTADEIIVIYYYKHISGGVIEKHIDDLIGEIIYNEVHTGNEGDTYNIKSKPQNEDTDEIKEQFDGYELVQEKIPINAQGIMTNSETPIVVIYYYKYPTKVTAKYIDKITNEDIIGSITIDGYNGQDYTTENKSFENYELIEVPENSNGTMTKDEIVVKYYYIYKSAGVVINYYDVDTGEKLKDEQRIIGYEGDNYDTIKEEFVGYDIVEEKLPNNSKGKMTKEEIKVNYYYKKEAKVNVEHRDKTTGLLLDKEELNGHINDEYKTNQKEYVQYDLVSIPENAEGTMTEEDIVVTYYYIKKAEVNILFVEEKTEKELSEQEEKKGHVGDKYVTNAKEIENYVLVKTTENTSGEMKNEKIIVKYYYRPKVFNLKIDKWVDSAKIEENYKRGQDYKQKEDIYKIDINSKKIETAEVMVTYKIRISNTGEIAGTANEIIETIPVGFEFKQEDNKIIWAKNERTLTTTVLSEETIEQGEYKEIEISLRWKKGDNNLGNMTNTVKLSKVSNKANFKEQTEEDNKAESKIIMTISTGFEIFEEPVTQVIIVAIIILTLSAITIIKKKSSNLK